MKEKQITSSFSLKKQIEQQAGALALLRQALSGIPRNHPLHLRVSLLVQDFEDYWVCQHDGNRMVDPDDTQEPDERLDYWLTKDRQCCD